MLFRAAQSVGLKGPRLLLKIAIPAALPDIAVGIRVGWSLSFGSSSPRKSWPRTKGWAHGDVWPRGGRGRVIVYGIIPIGLLNLLTDYLL